MHDQQNLILGNKFFSLYRLWYALVHKKDYEKHATFVSYQKRIVSCDKHTVPYKNCIVSYEKGIVSYEKCTVSYEKRIVSYKA